MPYPRLRDSLTLAAAVAALAPAGDRPAGPVKPTGDGPVAEWVLPNGRLVRPAQPHAPTGGFPLGIAVTPDRRWVVVANCGAGKQSVSVHRATDLKRVGDVEVKALHGGVAVSPDGKQVWACGGGADAVLRFSLSADGRLEAAGEVACPGYPAACALSPDGRRLYAACSLDGVVRIVDTEERKAAGSIETGGEPSAIALTRDGRRAYVTNRADRTVSVLDLEAARPLRTLPAGGQPCAVALAPDGRRAYVANANDDTLTVIETERDTVADTVRLRPYAQSPVGAIPNGLAADPDGKTLYVALAGISAVGVVSLPQHALTAMLPTGWYPTGLASDGRAGLFVLSSKGTGSGPNAKGGHVSRLMRGLLQRLEPRDEAARRQGTAAVRQANGFGAGARERSPAGAGRLPRDIKHVVLIVRENRSFDQVLGDLPGVNGDPKLADYGGQVTPNLHALARRFAVCDNAYAEGEVSLQGRQWSLGAYCSDHVEKTWPDAVSGRRRPGKSQHAEPPPHAYPALGYMADHCVRHHVTCRVYGGQVRRERGGAPIPSMRGVLSEAYPGWNLKVPDVERVRVWQQDLDRGVFAAFTHLWLPNNHTAGTQEGMPAPRAMVAENDLATGLVIGALSRRPEWRHTVVFLIEDDAQDGRDHVDAHRVPLLVMSPWVKAGAVSNRHYSTSSVYATIERLLGMPPMSQFDDLAGPIDDIWADTPDLRPYAVEMNRVPLDEVNRPPARRG